MKNSVVMKFLVLVGIFMFMVSCDEEDDYNCPENIELPLPTNTGENIVACKIDSEVWIGNKGMSHGSGFYSTDTPFFRFYPLPKYDSNGRIKSNEFGSTLYDTLYKLEFITDFIYDCEKFHSSEFNFNVVTSLNSKKMLFSKNTRNSITFWNSALEDTVNDKYHYRLIYEEPYTFWVELDTLRRQASGTFSGIFEEFLTGEQISITEGFFDMKTGWPDDR